MKKTVPFFLLTALLFSYSACKKTTETLDTVALSAYYPLSVGKYITYNLDSLVYINFGASSQVRKYQVKYVTDAQITDNVGRPSFRIIRYSRKTAANPWIADATFFVTNTGNTIEFVENNLRYQKLKSPVRNEYTWKGNSYIDSYSLNSNLKYLSDWEYTYDSVHVKSTVGTFTLDSTLKVNQRDEIIGNPGDANSYSEINFGMEKYARGIGMVYRRFFHSEYQPPTPGQTGKVVDGSYGVTYTMIDHN